MIRLIMSNGALNFLHKIAEHRSHGLHHLARVFTGGTFRFQSIRLAVGNLKRSEKCLRKMRSTQWKCANPTSTVVGDNHITGLRSNIQNHNRFVLRFQGQVI